MDLSVLKLSRWIALASGFALCAECFAADRFAAIVEATGEPTVTKGGYVVNQKRVAVQAELSKRPPTSQDLGVRLPPGSALKLHETAGQIAHYHPIWRVYEYRLTIPRAEFISFFEAQGLRFDKSGNLLKFDNAGNDFIDGLSGDPMTGFRVWRKP